jgi:hypothetical protein
MLAMDGGIPATGSVMLTAGKRFWVTGGRRAARPRAATEVGQGPRCRAFGSGVRYWSSIFSVAWSEAS